MKKIIYYLILLIGSISFFLLSCNKETVWTSERETAKDVAFLKVVHVAPSIRQIFNARDSFNVFIGPNKINGSFITYNGTAPASSNYFAVSPGVQSARFSVNGVTMADSVTFYTFNKTFKAGEYYSLIITDSINSAKEESRMLIQDFLVTPTPSNYAIRFVHAVLNDTAGKNVDLFSVKQKKNLFTGLTRGGYTGFVEFPVLGTDTLIVRRTGTMNELTRINGFTNSATKIYTAVYRGTTSPATTNPRPRGLITYVNQ